MPSTINLQNVQIKNGNTWYTMCPFPVGFIYLSQKSTSPATTFGGTWAALNEDRFLRPSNAWTTGGSKKISVDQMPSHTHKYGNYFSIVYDWTDVDPIRVIASGSDSSGIASYFNGLQSTGGARITGLNTEIVMVGIGLHSPHQIGIGLYSLYPLDGGEC